MINGLFRTAGLAAFFLALWVGSASAQTDCVVQTKAQLLQSLADNVRPGAITPRVFRNVVCSTFGGGGGGGGGSVTTLSVNTANGFAGLVTNPTTTPAITLSTTISGLLKGNGTAIGAATAGTDFLLPGGSGNNLIFTGTGAAGTAACLTSGGKLITSGSAANCFAGGGGGLPIINAAAAPYNVKCDNSTDDTTGINAALAAVTGQTQTVLMPAGHCKITAALHILISGTQFIGQGGNDGSAGGGSGTALVPNFGTGDALTIGSTAGNVNGTLVQGIAIVPSVTRTGGAGIHLYGGGWNIQRDIKIYNMYVGMQHDGECQPAGTGNCDYDNILEYASINSNAAGGVIIGKVGSTTSNGFPQNVFINNSDISVNGVAGIVVHNCGGCVFRFAQGILNTVGMRIDPGNNQLTLFQASDMGWDTSTNAALDFEATGTGQVGGTFVNGWYASSGNDGGHQNPLAVGIRFNMGVANFQPIQFVGGSIYNNAGPGVFEAQQTKYVTFSGVNNFSNSAFSGGGPVCPTATPACNNNGVYANYLGAAGTTNLTISGGNWGVGNGLTNWPTYGIDFAGSTITNVSITGINVAGTTASGSCPIGGSILTGGIRCGNAVTSAAAGIVGVTGGGGGGGVTSFGGAAGNIVSCGNSGCTSVGGSAASFGGSSLNLPAGWTFNSGSTPMAASGANSDITSLAIGTKIGGNNIATNSFAGSPGNLVAIGAGGGPDMAASSLNITGAQFIPPNNTLDLGDGSHFWKTVFAITGTINTSDRTLKTKIADETRGLGFIRALRPVEFDWIEGQGDGGHHSGLIAQEVEKADPGFPGLYRPKNPNEHYGLNYGEFTAPIIKAIQQMEAQIIDLQARPR